MTGFPTMRTAFRTTVSGGGKYEMVFRFPSMDDLHAADDEWRAALATPASDVVAVDVDDAQALAREFKRMQGLIYCPGVLRCAKCDFRLIKTTLTPAGAFANEEPDSCPNCNVPMWRVTWQDEAHEAYRVAESQMERALGAEKKLAHPLLAQSVDPVAVLQYDKVTCGNENEMPKVISCNWLPDGEYPVFLAAPVPVEPVAGGEALREAVRDALASELGDTYDCGRVWEAWSVGTMGEDDFTPVNDRVDEIADAILAALKGPAA